MKKKLLPPLPKLLILDEAEYILRKDSEPEFGPWFVRYSTQDPYHKNQLITHTEWFPTKAKARKFADRITKLARRFGIPA